MVGLAFVSLASIMICTVGGLLWRTSASFSGSNYGWWSLVTKALTDGVHATH
jgi:hypothetical protein